MVHDEKIILYENILTSMNDGLIAISSDGEMFMINPAAEKILEYSREQLEGKGWGEVFFLQGGNEEFNQVILDVIYEKKIKYSRIVPYCTPSGKKKILAMNSSYLRDVAHREKPLIGMIVLFYDITEFYKLQEREKKLLIKARELTQEKAEALKKLAQGVAHEIRNPVTAIGGFAARLYKENPNLKYLENIIQSAKRLENIVAQVSSFTKLTTPRKEPCNLLALMEDVLICHSPSISSHNIKVSFECELPENEKIYVDGSLLKETLDIMIQNAVEAMESGGVLTLRCFKKNGDICIEIHDSGKGISEEDLPYIFDPFFSTKTNAVGMSLAKAKKIINDHGGYIEVESKPGEGSRFRIILPPGKQISNS